MAESNELQVKTKQEVATPAEHTRSGLLFTPEVDIFETEHEITVLADMPGVASDGVNIELHEGVLTLNGEIKPWENAGETDVLIEFETGRYYRQFSVSNAIDQSKIDAKLEDGILRLTLPKAQKAMPRQITITAG